MQDHVAAALSRDKGSWHCKNACLACTYKVEDKLEMKYSMLITIDGNNSLKQVLCCKTAPCTGEDGNTLSPFCKCKDNCEIAGDYYLTRDQVDQWAEGIQKDEKKGDEMDGKVFDDNPCEG